MQMYLVQETCVVGYTYEDVRRVFWLVDIAFRNWYINRKKSTLLSASVCFHLDCPHADTFNNSIRDFCRLIVWNSDV